jgi:deoxyguanosine kinase
MASVPYIAFEGPIGAGKTTHALLLSAKMGGALILENFEDNEFLADFYSDKQRWAFSMQLWFLAARHKQLRETPTSTFEPIVADYSYLKNDVFAELLLEGRELRLYNQLSIALTSKILVPSVIVYLDARDVVLLTRIGKRNRAYEAGVDRAYLEKVRQAYERTFAAVADLNVVRYDTSDLDLSSEQEIEKLHATILAAGKQNSGHALMLRQGHPGQAGPKMR